MRLLSLSRTAFRTSLRTPPTALKSACYAAVLGAMAAMNAYPKAASASHDTEAATVPSRSADHGSAAAGMTPADSALRKSETMAGLHQDLDTLGKKIEQLKLSIEKAGTKAKKKTQADLAALEKTRQGIAARLDSLGDATADAWDKMKSRATREMDELKADIDRVKKKAKG